MNDALQNPFIKSVSINELPESAWTYITGTSTEQANTQKYYQAVPWLFRGVDIRANAVAGMPFSIYRGETEIDNSDDYQNAVKFLPNPRAIFKILEAALTIWNYAYLFRQRNQYMTRGLRYLLPTSIRAKIDETTGEVTFKRRVGGRDIDYTPEDIIYFWKADPFVEAGPPQASPAMAAASAAGVLLNVDDFAAAFFKRGAIKATLLTTQNILPQERDRLKTWWQRMFGRGSDSAWQTDIVNADMVKPVVVGEGLESLDNDKLTESKRIDIAAALGIPYSVLFSNASNRATAEQDDLHLYSKTIIPDCNFIAEVMNEQVFEPLGYRLAFTPQNLDLFQEDENERAQSLVHVIAALDKPEEFLLAADILGFDIAPDVLKKIEALVAEKAKAREQMVQIAMTPREPEQPPAQPEQEQEREQQPPPNMRSIDLSKWQLKATKLVKRGKPAACAFESEYIDPVLKAAIGAQLEEAETAEDIERIFADVWVGYP